MGSRGVRELRDKNVLITGAASGIGAATAKAAGASGARLYLTDRSGELLASVVDQLRASGATVAFSRTADISDLDAITAMADDIHAEGVSMDVVMNIAGISAWGSVDRLEHRHWRSMVEVNLMGPIHVIESFVPEMIRAGRGGYLVNVSSAAGLIGLPWHAAYSASKFGLRGISEVLRFDLRQHGIGVSLVCPGGVATPLTETVEIAGIDQTGSRFEKLQAHFRKRAVTPDQAAGSILKGMRRGKYFVYTSFDIRLIHRIQRVFPPLYSLVMLVFQEGFKRALPVGDAPVRAGEKV